MILAKAIKLQPKTFPKENYHEDKGQTIQAQRNTERVRGLSWAIVCVIDLHVEFCGHTPANIY